MVFFAAPKAELRWRLCFLNSCESSLTNRTNVSLSCVLPPRCVGYSQSRSDGAIRKVSERMAEVKLSTHRAHQNCVVGRTRTIASQSAVAYLDGLRVPSSCSFPRSTRQSPTTLSGVGGTFCSLSNVCTRLCRRHLPNLATDLQLSKKEGENGFYRFFKHCCLSLAQQFFIEAVDDEAESQWTNEMWKFQTNHSDKVSTRSITLALKCIIISLLYLMTTLLILPFFFLPFCSLCKLSFELIVQHLPFGYFSF